MSDDNLKVYKIKMYMTFRGGKEKWLLIYTIVKPRGATEKRFVENEIGRIEGGGHTVTRCEMVRVKDNARMDYNVYRFKAGKGYVKEKISK